jgi:hypothetical protein
MTYRQELDKIYKKIDSLSQGGDDAIMDFRDYIDQLVQYGQYGVLIDVMDLKYSIDIRGYKSVEDMKKDVFKKIKFQTKSKSLKNLDSVYKSKGIFSNGFHFYDSTTKQYLGDIQEVDKTNIPLTAYQDPKLISKLYGGPNLKITVGLSSSINSAIPPFDKNYTLNISYVYYSQVRYEGKVYECVNPYNWDYKNPITPTYSNYWAELTFPPYNVITLTDKNTNVFDKYREAVDILRNNNLIYTYENEVIAGDYVEDYFE